MNVVHARYPYRDRPLCNVYSPDASLTDDPGQVSCRRCLRTIAVPVDPRQELVTAATRWADHTISDAELVEAVERYERTIHD